MIEPDTKDWTWVLHQPCPDCGYDAAKVERTRIGDAVRDDATGWGAVLARRGVTARPDDQTWSPLEYACHVRDVNRIFGQRLALMLDQDNPTFENWDQDVTAVEDHYDRQDPSMVGPELAAAAQAVAAQYDTLADAAEATWSRQGLRSNGSEFTVDTLARYHLHDLVHHAHDVRGFAARATAAAYDDDADAFSEGTGQLTDQGRRRIDAFVAAVGSGTVLEIGSGGGRDAEALEERGLAVRRTDVSAGFVERLRGLGHDADVIDPLIDELGGPYDGVWASACLLHVARHDLPRVLARLAEATRPRGVLGLSVKEGDGEEWSSHGHVRAPRRFVYWREEPLRRALEQSGWVVRRLEVEASEFNGQPWLVGTAVRS